ncbi:MAG: DUF4388 domain-containing protein [Geobacteraceae bacterium]|nr:DUF4388 domain-containing protein [Geobacteraceae bacterium]
MSNNGILIFNQSGSDLSLISTMLEARDFTVFFTTMPLEAIHILKNNDIDVVLADAEIKGMDGQEFKELVENIKPGVSTFLLPKSLNGSISPITAQAVCTVDLHEFVQFLQNHIRAENSAVTESIRFKEFFFSFANRLLQLFEVKDNYFFNNDQMVAELSWQMAKMMDLEENLVDAIHLSALLKDLGKIGIQHEILNESRRLEIQDFDQIKCHPINTVQLLKQVNFPWDVESIILHHHEHYDGNGYPEGIKGREIPLGSRIIAIADSYVAMTTDRPYRTALTIESAIEEITRKAGTQFDPEVAEIFLAILQQKKQMKEGPRQILLISRDEGLSAALKLNIDSSELSIFTCANAAEAINYLGKKTPQLLITDSEVFNGDMSGFYEALRVHGLTDDTPTLILCEADKTWGVDQDEFEDVISKPVEIEQMKLRILSLLGDHGNNRRVETHRDLRGIVGSLEDMGLTDIIQLLNMGLKTARIALSNGTGKGEIFLKNGKIIYAETEKLKGNDAFFELVGWQNGFFRIFHGQSPNTINITLDTMHLLLEATRIIDENGSTHVQT